MRFQKLIGVFVLITAIGILYDKYKNKIGVGIQKEQFNLVEKHLLYGEGSDKPILWIHTEHNKNARHWASFYSRTNNNLNQPYINMCVETIIKWCGDSFNICLINDETYEKLLPSWSINLDKLPEPIRTRTRTLGTMKLLSKYGGVIMPNSMLMMRDFMPRHKEYLGRKGCYCGEFISRNNTSTLKRLFPSHKLIGCEKENETIKKLCNDLEILLSTDNSGSADFEGHIDKILYKNVKSGMMSLISGNLIGMKTNEDTVILLDDLLKETNIDFDKQMFGVYLPKDELLKRRNYEWFVRLNKVQIVAGNSNVSKLFSMSYSN
tara:strand:+ start:2100 stop:3062 length:963 start_codon:yes stop_codon:yes gene_type:complete